jgi:hypothetical protein
MKANFIQDEFAVEHTVRPDVGREFIKWNVPGGWAEIQKLVKKVVMYDGRKFVWSCWNSDGNYVVFARPLNGEEIKTAKFVK